MGHEEGKGLGRYGQGIVAPISESVQKDRTGLGLKKKGHFDGKVDSWDFNNDPVNNFFLSLVLSDKLTVYYFWVG